MAEQPGTKSPQSRRRRRRRRRRRHDELHEQVPPAANIIEGTSASYYFDSYSHYGIHEEMLKDKVRTESFRRAILGNADIFRGRIVLDVGCGTGILALFAAEAGARHVYGIEKSGIATQAQHIVDRNGFSDRITIFHARAEDVDLPLPQNSVDIILSEWMGYFLIYESMLDTVLFCRDRWLREGGIIMPDTCTLYACGVEDGSYKREKLDWWDSVYGFNMDVIKELAWEEPLVDVVDPRAVLTPPVPVLRIDVATACRGVASSFNTSFTLSASRDEICHALVTYFDVHFSNLPHPTSFSTAPSEPPTHWKQSLFYLRDDIGICSGEGLHVTLSCMPNSSNPRDLDISLGYAFEGTKGSVRRSQRFRFR